MNSNEAKLKYIIITVFTPNPLQYTNFSSLQKQIVTECLYHNWTICAVKTLASNMHWTMHSLQLNLTYCKTRMCP